MLQNNGLQYRFDPLSLEIWMFFYRCMWCGQNRWDAMHHIISPSSMGHRHGEFNASILNSCPIHNQSCHLNNGELHHRQTEINLLEKTMTYLKYKDYKLNDIDKEFQMAYWESHFNNFKNLLD